MVFFQRHGRPHDLTTSESKILRFPRYRHICLRAPGKCACNAINAFQTQPRYRHTFSVSQECVCNEYLLYANFFRERTDVQAFVMHVAGYFI